MRANLTYLAVLALTAAIVWGASPAALACGGRGC